MWQVARLDLRYAMSKLSDEYSHDAQKAFSTLSTLHIIIMVVLLLCASAVIMFMFRPFYRAACTGK